jgi:hypothetical protein
VDKELFEFLEKSGVQPYFALPWVLTWFSHSVATFNTVMRFFDLFLASDASMPLFVSVSVILWTKPYLLELIECEYSAVHSFYSKLFSDIPLELNLEPEDPRLKEERRFAQLIDADLEQIIGRAVKLHAKYASSFLSRECARPFVDLSRQFRLEDCEIVQMKQLPKAAEKPIKSLQYRFEGIVRKRKMARARTILIISLLVLILAWIVQRITFF